MLVGAAIGFFFESRSRPPPVFSALCRSETPNRRLVCRGLEPSPGRRMLRGSQGPALEPPTRPLSFTDSTKRDAVSEELDRQHPGRAARYGLVALFPCPGAARARKGQLRPPRETWFCCSTNERRPRASAPFVELERAPNVSRTTGSAPRSYVGPRLPRTGVFVFRRASWPCAEPTSFFQRAPPYAENKSAHGGPVVPRSRVGSKPPLLLMSAVMTHRRRDVLRFRSGSSTREGWGHENLRAIRAAHALDLIRTRCPRSPFFFGPHPQRAPFRLKPPPCVDPPPQPIGAVCRERTLLNLVESSEAGADP